MDIGAVFEITIAALAVFGLICLLKFMGERLFRPKNVFFAAAIFDRESAKNADILVEMIKSGSMGRKGCLLIGEELLGDDELMELVKLSGVNYYITKK